mgnify:CR=1 FL=1
MAANDTVICFLALGEQKAMDAQIWAGAIDFGAVGVAPGIDEISAGKYDKLTRTAYLYVNNAALAKASANNQAFVARLVKGMDKFVRFANLVPLRTLQYQQNFKRLTDALK